MSAWEWTGSIAERKIYKILQHPKWCTADHRNQRMDGPSITKDHGAKQVRKLKVSLQEIVLVEGSRSKSRHSYCPRRYDEDRHTHKVVPVLLIRERKEMSVLVLLHEHHVRIQHAIDYRLYDLSKSKRLEGKMRREEIFRRISYPKTNSNECSAW